MRSSSAVPTKTPAAAPIAISFPAPMPPSLSFPGADRGVCDRLVALLLFVERPLLGCFGVVLLVVSRGEPLREFEPPEPRFVWLVEAPPLLARCGVVFLVVLGDEPLPELEPLVLRELEPLVRRFVLLVASAITSFS